MRNLFESVTGFFNEKHRINPLADSQLSIEKWFNSPLGQHLLAQEERDLKSIVPSCGAHRMVTLGVTSEQKFFQYFNHIHSFSISASMSNVGSSGAIADFDTLPLPSETVDTVFLHHALEFSVSPHDVLKEASRVLKPSGHMVLVVLNPVSLLGLAKWPLRIYSSSAIWRHYSLRYGRILDWLRLLNIEPEQAVSGRFSWPLLSPKLLCAKSSNAKAPSVKPQGNSQWHRGEKATSRFNLFCGAYYIVVARKYIARPTLLESPKWTLPSTPIVSGAKKTEHN